jgi:hypothetical protein
VLKRTGIYQIVQQTSGQVSIGEEEAGEMIKFRGVRTISTVDARQAVGSGNLFLDSDGAAVALRGDDRNSPSCKEMSIYRRSCVTKL